MVGRVISSLLPRCGRGGSHLPSLLGLTCEDLLFVSVTDDNDNTRNLLDDDQVLISSVPIPTSSIRSVAYPQQNHRKPDRVLGIPF
ncbi:Hypothetical protein NTJ_04983 [Nesidiocoris tenuis]|uniref:Uncharacterized protein n=1 Tax=Nesidiocoris tenuis TaxID=355587 RepID=A0ABN7AMQ2_9HEMI|nr:Hypothetical protein NTJ_04983 [Nesidiocoris tenuis]